VKEKSNRKNEYDNRENEKDKLGMTVAGKGWGMSEISKSHHALVLPVLQHGVRE
jgi:hypothetical protein